LAQNLGNYAGRTDEAIEKLERELAAARKLRLGIGEGLGRCQASLGRAKPAPR